MAPVEQGFDIDVIHLWQCDGPSDQHKVPNVSSLRVHHFLTNYAFFWKQ